MSKINLPPCRCGDPDRFHEGPCSTLDDGRIQCRPPTTLENVVRSPRFYCIFRYIDGWIVSIVVDPSVGMVSNIDGPTLDDAITAAALRIDALDAADQAAPRQTWDDAVSDPIGDVCAIARLIAGQKEPPPSPEGRPLSHEERKP